jgi:hypothetical protein
MALPIRPLGSNGRKYSAGAVKAGGKLKFLAHFPEGVEVRAERTMKASLLRKRKMGRRCVDGVSACWTLQGSFSPRLLI